MRKYLSLLAFLSLALALPVVCSAQGQGPQSFTLGALNQCATINTDPKSTSGVYVDVSGTFSATLQPEASVAGSSYKNVAVTPTTSQTQQSTITSTGGYNAAVAGPDHFQVCVSAYTSGSAVVVLSPTTGVASNAIGGRGSGTTNPANQYFFPYYSGSGSSSILSGIGPQTGYDGVPQIPTETTSSGSPTSPSIQPSGVPVNAQNGATYPIAATDRGKMVQLTNDTTSTAVSVSAAGSAGFAYSFDFAECNIGTSANLYATVPVTNTPATSTINGNATQTLQGEITGENPSCAFWWSDGLNYWGPVIPPTDANGRMPLNYVSTPTGAITPIALGNNPFSITSAQTTNSQNSVSIAEAAAATGTGENELNVATLGNSTAVPLNVSQGAITNTTATPAVSISSTYNDASLVGLAFKLAVTNTSSSAAGLLMQLLAGTSGATSEFAVSMAGTVVINGTYETANGLQGNASTTNIQVSSGLSTVSSNGPAPYLLVNGEDDSNSGSAVVAGPTLIRGGLASNATPNAAALMGTVQIAGGAVKSTIANLNDVVCFTSSTFTVTDCPLGTGTVAGIASSTSNPISYVHDGQITVKTDNASVVGDVVCGPMVTAGLAHDNGTKGCPPGIATVGIVIANSGSNSITMINGTGTTTSTPASTLPLVQLHIAQGISNSNNVTSTQSITATGASFTAITNMTLPAAPASVTLRGMCTATWEQATAASTATFAVENSAAPTALYVTAIPADSAFVAPTYTNVTATSFTAVTGALTGSTSAFYQVTFYFTLVNSTSLDTVSFGAQSGSSSDAVVIQPGSSCGWLP